MENAGTRVFPPGTTKNNQHYGIRIGRGEPVQGKPDTLRLKLQINSNAESKTLGELARKDSHKVVSMADIDTKQEVTEENLDKIEEEFLKNIDI